MSVKFICKEDVFSGEDHLALDQYLKTMSYFPVDLGDATMYAGELPPFLKKLVEDKISEIWGEELVPIATFARLNDEDLDNLFRVHSDGEIQGQQPTVAAVYYIECGGSGTALMSHPDHGDRGVGIFTEDDGLWHVDKLIPGDANSMVVYEADAFHTRHPHQTDDTRVVIVSFLRGKE